MRLGGGGATIGFFDSGVGGVSVWHEVVKRLPHYVTLYVADNAHCPYGPRPPEQVQHFSRGIARFLIDRGAKLIVVACNTASAAALASLREEFDVPFVGMEPAVKPASQQTETGHIGILATKGTASGDLFRDTSERYAIGATVHIQIGEGLVERVEAGQAYLPETEELLRQYLQPMIDSNVDQVVLGCTHYAFLLPVIRRIVPEGVAVIDPGTAVARQVERVVMSRPAEWIGSEADPAPQQLAARFFASDRPDILAAIVEARIGWQPQIDRVAWQDGKLHSL